MRGKGRVVYNPTSTESAGKEIGAEATIECAESRETIEFFVSSSSRSRVASRSYRGFSRVPGDEPKLGCAGDKKWAGLGSYERVNGYAMRPRCRTRAWG